MAAASIGGHAGEFISDPATVARIQDIAFQILSLLSPHQDAAAIRAISHSPHNLQLPYHLDEAPHAKRVLDALDKTFRDSPPQSLRDLGDRGIGVLRAMYPAALELGETAGQFVRPLSAAGKTLVGSDEVERAGPRDIVGEAYATAVVVAAILAGSATPLIADPLQRTRVLELARRVSDVLIREGLFFPLDGAFEATLERVHAVPEKLLLEHPARYVGIVDAFVGAFADDVPESLKGLVRQGGWKVFEAFLPPNATGDDRVEMMQGLAAAKETTFASRP
ncbi:MAG: hypothetical protein ACKVPX_16400 [Myxococcaceae bacterium]